MSDLFNNDDPYNYDNPSHPYFLEQNARRREEEERQQRQRQEEDDAFHQAAITRRQNLLDEPLSTLSQDPDSYNSGVLDQTLPSNVDRKSMATGEGADTAPKDTPAFGSFFPKQRIASVFSKHPATTPVPDNFKLNMTKQDAEELRRRVAEDNKNRLRDLF